MVKATLHNQNFFEWTKQQAEYLLEGRWEELDIENLVEELEALGHYGQRELGLYLQVLITHLLKCQYQPDQKIKNWEFTISNYRYRIQDCLEDTPSLNQFLQNSEWVEKYYQRSRRDAAAETQIPPEIFPAKCPYSIEQLLGSNVSL